MTAVVFVVALILAYLHWKLAPVGWLITGHLTIYVAAFAATLSSACVAAILSRDDRCVIVAGMLVANFIVSHYAWTTGDPILVDGANNLVFAVWFVLFGVRRWEFIIGGLLLAASFTAGLAGIGLIPDHLTRDNSYFIAFSYPDIVALLGHAANITLGLGAGDGGRLVRTPLEVRGVLNPLGRDALVRLGLVAKSTKETED